MTSKKKTQVSPGEPPRKRGLRWPWTAAKERTTAKRQAKSQDNGSWNALAGPTPAGLLRRKMLHNVGWYEALDDDALLTSTRQVVPTWPALVGASSAGFTGRPLGMDGATGQLVASDPYVLYRLGVLESVNVLIAGDVGVAKSTLCKDHYVGGALLAGRQVCVFDRKLQETADGRVLSGYGEYGRAARLASASGLKVTSLAFSLSAAGSKINVLDPAIAVRGDADGGTVGQDLLLLLVAELAHGPLNTEERWCLDAAHRHALDQARKEGRVAVLGDVVDALFTLSAEEATPHQHLIDSGVVDANTFVEWGLRLAIDLSRSDVKSVVDGPTADTAGNPLDLDADLLVIDTAELEEGSDQLVLVMALMSAYVSSVWARSQRESVVVVEEGYSADLPSVGQVFRSMAKRGRGLGLSLVFVIHHLSDIPVGSPMKALIKEVGIVHIFRQETDEDAIDCIKTFGLPVSISDLRSLPKGTHVLQEGGGRARLPRTVCHVQTHMDRWVTWTDDLLNATAAPPSPFSEDHDPTEHSAALRVAKED